MAAYLIGQIQVKDAGLWQQYVAGVSASLQPYAAEIVFRGRLARVLAGELELPLSVVIRFADQQTLQDWFESDAYQGLIPLRERAADVIIASYDE